MSKSIKATIKIVNWVTGSVVYESKEAESLKEAVIEANLRGANLYGANLRGADLRGADLYGADLRGADLYGADLRGANLRGADLYGADLRGANLRGANLRGADLYGADLRGANLRGANLRGADLYGANLRGADLYGADLRGADLRGIPIDRLPEDYVNQCSRDILFVLEHLKSEVPFLREKLVAGEVDGTVYEGDCACLVGSLANADKTTVDAVCEAIPYYRKGTHNPGEQWFLNIREGDTPKNNEFAAHALKLIDIVLEAK
jgi:hypothetical protein